MIYEDILLIHVSFSNRMCLLKLVRQLFCETKKIVIKKEQY